MDITKALAILPALLSKGETDLKIFQAILASPLALPPSMSALTAARTEALAVTNFLLQAASWIDPILALLPKPAPTPTPPPVAAAK